jgi:GNAT superfamily N-acetyltransferase
VLIRPLGPDEWETFKEVRLASLREAPYAFGATLEDATARSDEGWREGLSERTQLVAVIEGATVGTVGGIGDPATGAAELVSMWVAPEWRGRGMGAELVGAVVTWAAGQDFVEVRLWVAEGNEAAERLYSRCGFTRTGAAQPIREGEARLELEMVRRL